MKTATYLKTLTRSAGRTIRRLLRHLTGKTTINASLTLSIPGFVKLELGWKRESERADDRKPA
ncbi:hypothetical protein EAH89_13300 [Roseomonas nepalensis]|uniref:Uncharacterized protein n=1 Tax=Muricoccus nepalensis TaxID=1854500 RepID=A0A502G2Y0_9PROT|nr:MULTISPECIES: hypothetical protein [Roseomonas]MBI0538248.1 hypothetical protein [Roseomonas sp. KE2513]TPG55910.1 hypothetical protein EAH89_13300 [Roseomonas nepalensis]